MIQGIDLLTTYIYIIGHYNPSVRIINLVSHTTYVVCINFIHKYRIHKKKNNVAIEFSKNKNTNILFQELSSDCCVGL